MEESKSYILNNHIKKRILEICVIPHRMVDLNRKLNISRGALRHHLNILEKEGLIEEMYREQLGKGRPTLIKTNVDKFRELENRKKTEFEDFKNIFLSEPLTKHVLDILKKGTANIDVLTMGLSYDDTLKIKMYVLPKLLVLGYIKERYELIDDKQ